MPNLTLPQSLRRLSRVLLATFLAAVAVSSARGQGRWVSQLPEPYNDDCRFGFPEPLTNLT